jgi:hypothetical protein
MDWSVPRFPLRQKRVDRHLHLPCWRPLVERDYHPLAQRAVGPSGLFDLLHLNQLVRVVCCLPEVNQTAHRMPLRLERIDHHLYLRHLRPFAG